MDLLHDTHAWVTVSFLIFCVFAFKFGKAGFLNMLDSRIKAIRTEIETAETLRVEAQELLAQYQRKQRDAETEAKEIVKTAKAHAKKITKQAKADLSENMKRREQQLTERLTRMEANAVQEIKEHASDLAVKATAEIISAKLDKSANERLIDESIKQVAGQI